MSKYDESDLLKDVEEIDSEKTGVSSDSLQEDKDFDIVESELAEVSSDSDQIISGNDSLNSEEDDMEGDEVKVKKPRKSKKKFRLNIVQFIKFVLCIILICALLGAGYVTAIIAKAPKIQTDNIYSLLSQSSILYDDQGKIIDNIYGEQNRTLVEIKDIPEHVQKAFIALEDKTFETHSGFNIIRIFGAIKDAIFSGRGVSGTSTITQQLARNLYLEDIKSERSVSRKITEAYYTVQLEQKLDKDQIIEAYLNTVYFGENQYGIQTASHYYFSKDVADISVAQAALLASIPQMPSVYAPVLSVSLSDVDEDSENLITKTDGTAFIWNNEAQERMHLCIELMKEQGLIDEEQYQEAIKCEIKDLVDPNIESLTTNSGYFNDFVMSQVVKDLQEEYGYDEEKAIEIAYKGGLNIYTTLDAQAQSVLEKEFKKDSNFPYPTSYSTDGNGNILGASGEVLLYKFKDYMGGSNTFVLNTGDFKWNDDGSLLIYRGKKLLFYNTTVQGETDYSVEFKSMYFKDDGLFYTISGGYINIPQPYKSKDEDGNLIISADFFKDYPEFFEKGENSLSTKEYTLQTATVQPQAAMTIIDNKTGAVKAMAGGRKTSGRMIFNRATSPRQPGSSLKPLSVYSAALQKSFECSKNGQFFPYIENGLGNQGTNLWGNYITAGSIVLDEPTTVNGKKWPKNDYNSYKGFFTLRRAIEMSVNVCAVKTVQQVGVDYSYKLCKKFGISTLVDESDGSDKNLAALGVGGLTKGASTLEMASAYTTFVNDGVHKSYTCYTKVTNRNGDVLLEPNVTETQVLDPGVAWIMRDMLQSTVYDGIAYNAAISGEKVGGKSGTTDRSIDLWFDGFTANYTASLWMGSDVSLPLSTMSGQTVYVWGRIMRQIDNAYGGKYSSRPSNVVSVKIDTKSGLLATEESKSTRTEYFTAGTQPTDAGTITATKKICKDSHFLATPSCPNFEEKTGVVMPYELSENEVKLYGALPIFYCNLHNPDPNKYPVKKGLDVTIVPIPPEDDPDNPDPGIGENPGENPGEGSDDDGDEGGNNSGNGNSGNGNSGNQGNSPNPR